MTASDAYSQSLSSLTDTRAAMLSPAWIAALETQSQATRIQASQCLLQVQQAITALSSANLADIANEMAAQQKDIQQATTNLDDALDDITKVQNVLNAVASVIKIIGQIAPLF